MNRYLIKYQQGNSKTNQFENCVLHSDTAEQAVKKLKQVYSDSQMSATAKKLNIISICQVSQEYELN